MPLVEWIRREMKDQFLHVLLEPQSWSAEAVRSLVDEHVRGRRNRRGMLWRMLILELWHRNFMEARSDWGVARRASDVFVIEASRLPRPVEAMQVQPSAGNGRPARRLR